ncbi:Aste57867_1029 [Aphanomyces stellatus]|uniref:Aste57867_1029 protein n=1 Tax=Aphanomyces stellatus TaxID=120398 RepID=A0A485K9L8_9STRA|nr:hypothetical protein As57867_001028 [Aphanomyces stellatus]VFT78251.1 Aste57867_1029 [Aphanomyces stellatus]
MAVGKSASTTGAPMAVHSADCGNCDYRIGKVPQKTFEAGAMRDVVRFRLQYPRYVGDARGDVFKEANVDKSVFNWKPSPSIGQIPQVNTTFGYLAGLYGIMNEHQVSMGESTCGGRLVSAPVSDGGKALFDVAELTHVAMERAKTARDAIRIMGSLAEEHGYYGADWDSPGAAMEAGESLTVADPNEIWLFHIHPDDTGASAVWVAQRLPDDHVAAIANQFVIHAVNLTDSDNFMGSTNMVDVAIRAKLYDPAVNGTFDFTRVYAHPIVPDQYYATRRQWRVLTKANPALDLSPVTDTFGMDYPVSVQAAAPVSPAALMSWLRDHFEGTDYDMTQGPAAGPYGNPDRYDINGNGNMTKQRALDGHFERAISIFRSSYSFVTVASPTDASLGHILFGQYGPHATAYIPIYTKVAQVPELYSRGSLHRYDHNTSFWAFAMVGNWASHFYKYTIPLVQAVQAELEDTFLAKHATVALNLKALTTDEATRRYLTETSAAYATTTHEAFVDLFGRLVTTFHDGYYMHNLTAETITPQSLFYPEWWLQQVGYFDAAVVMPTFITSNEGASTMLYMAIVLLGAFVCLGVGFGLGMQRHQKGYMKLN